MDRGLGGGYESCSYRGGGGGGGGYNTESRGPPPRVYKYDPRVFKYDSRDDRSSLGGSSWEDDRWTGSMPPPRAAGRGATHTPAELERREERFAGKGWDQKKSDAKRTSRATSSSGRPQSPDVKAKVAKAKDRSPKKLESLENSPSDSPREEKRAIKLSRRASKDGSDSDREEKRTRKNKRATEDGSESEKSHKRREHDKKSQLKRKRKSESGNSGSSRSEHDNKSQLKRKCKSESGSS